MSFKLNTNIASINSRQIGVANNRDLSNSLVKLSSGLRINKSADDGAGQSIADSLRKQSSAIGQSIKNANGAIGIIQIADKAMNEQIEILDTIKIKATQAAQDGQTAETRKSIQADISKLLETLDSIAKNTTYNGQNLLNGNFVNKRFQVGAYANQDVKVSINSTNSSKIGSVRFETTTIVSGTSQLTFSAIAGQHDIALESVDIGSLNTNTGIGALSDMINKNSDRLGGVRASWSNTTTGSSSVIAGSITDLTINNITIGDVANIKTNDNNGTLVNIINKKITNTGVEAFTDTEGKINLRSVDGRGVVISASSGLANIGLNVGGDSNFGRLTLRRESSKDIGLSDSGLVLTTNASSQATMNLADTKGRVDKDLASAIGMFENLNQANNITADSINIGVTTMAGALAIMDIADSALKHLDNIRAEIGSNQSSFTSTINNISVTKINIDASESQIRDVDFASESSTFQRQQILSQSGSYALSQANQIPQNVVKLLQ